MQTQAQKNRTAEARKVEVYTLRDFLTDSYRNENSMKRIAILKNSIIVAIGFVNELTSNDFVLTLSNSPVMDIIQGHTVYVVL